MPILLYTPTGVTWQTLVLFFGFLLLNGFFCFSFTRFTNCQFWSRAVDKAGNSSVCELTLNIMICISYCVLDRNASVRYHTSCLIWHCVCRTWYNFNCQLNNRQNSSAIKHTAVFSQSMQNELIILAQNRRLFLGHFTQLIVYSWKWMSEQCWFQSMAKDWKWWNRLDIQWSAVPNLRSQDRKRAITDRYTTHSRDNQSWQMQISGAIWSRGRQLWATHRWGMITMMGSL